MIKNEILAKNAPDSIEDIFKVKIGPKMTQVIAVIQDKVSE